MRRHDRMARHQSVEKHGRTLLDASAFQDATEFMKYLARHCAQQIMDSHDRPDIKPNHRYRLTVTIQELGE